MINLQKILRFTVIGMGAALALMLSAFASETGTTTDSGLRLRAKPSTDSAIYTHLSKGTKLDILETLDGWYHVSVDGMEGYVSSAYVSKNTSDAQADAAQAVRQGIVTGGTINVRTGPSTDYSKITTVRSGKLVTIQAEQDGWYQISFDDITGYICGDYLKDYDASASTIGDQVTALASQYLGIPYVYGGSSPNGFDCSGLTLYVYKQLGYSLPHSATSQYNNCGQFVAKEDLQPGDLVFFSDSSHSIGHVAIYIGNNEILHARSSLGIVTTNSLSMSYYTNNYVGAKRIA